MLYRIAQTAVVICGILVLGPRLHAADQLPPASPPNQGMILLRNGQTIEGRITQTDGLYVVDLGDGQIRLKAADVDLVCATLEDGYRQKRATIQVGNAQDHIELAGWCLRHGLLGPAATELADATVAEPNNPMIGVLHHRLKMAMEPPPKPEAAGKSVAGPSNDELDRMVRSLPHGVVETFTQSVQPVLMNHCATGGCHGPQSETGLRLFRVPSGKQASRRITQRNLYSVLPYVDRDNPAISRLLTAANGPHGTAKQAIFSDHQASQYQRMADWASQLAGQSTPDSPPTLAPAMPFEPAGPPPPRVLSQEARNARPLSADGKRQSVRRNTARKPVKPPAPADASSDQSADPLDPEIFNRRYAPRRNKRPPGSEFNVVGTLRVPIGASEFTPHLPDLPAHGRSPVGFSGL